VFRELNEARVIKFCIYLQYVKCQRGVTNFQV